ncbi:MAG: hypothetical protein K2Y14_00860 [Burkholderiales bacterium]|nr:hypothetical protein [Burkholderiales bacterium]
MIKRVLTLVSCAVFLVGCLGIGEGGANNIQLSTTAGNCPAGAINAPYCMAVKIENNPNGQNYINSTNYPISSIAVTTSGASNLISPMFNASSMDPNGCTSTTIQPGWSCTFYVAISSEAYQVGSYNPINITINYTVNDSLFTNGDHTASNSTTIYQRTNLYILNNTANLWVWNNNGLSYAGLAESANMSGQALLSSTLGYVTGKLILSNNNSIWSYGNGVVSSAANSGILSGANLLFSLSNGIYASAYTTGNFWIGTESSSSLTWSNTGLPAVPVNANAYALSPSSNLYVAVGGQALNCSGITNSSATKACNNEAVGFSSGSINTFGYAGLLYAGSSNSNGMYYESGTGTTATWVPITQLPTTTLGTTNVMKTATNGSYVIAADSINNIWSITSGSTSATKVTTAPGSVTALAIDNITSSPNIYYVANNQLYSCGSGGFASCAPAVLASGLTGTMLNLIIGSSLSTN